MCWVHIRRYGDVGVASSRGTTRRTEPPPVQLLRVDSDNVCTMAVRIRGGQVQLETQKGIITFDDHYLEAGRWHHIALTHLKARLAVRCVPLAPLWCAACA